MIRGSILNPSKKGGVKRRDLLFVLNLLSLIFAISLIYTWKMKKKLLFFADYRAVLLKTGKNLGKWAIEAPSAENCLILCFPDFSEKMSGQLLSC
jgi:hypothetical protein